MRTHFQPHPSTTISGSNPCVIKFEIGKEGLPRGLLPALAAGNHGFESCRSHQFPSLDRWGTNAGPHCLAIGHRENARPVLHRLMQIPRLIGPISNPQPNPQNALSCTTCAAFGSPRGLVSSCKT